MKTVLPSARMLLITAMIAFIISGCAVLIAKATEKYGPVPSNAIKTWAELKKPRR